MLLPALPDRDVNAYPYAFIAIADGSVDNYTRLYFSDTAEVCRTGGMGGWLWGVDFSDSVIYYTLDDNSWVGPSLLAGFSGTYEFVSRMVWSNIIDLYNQDGSLHLAASDPVPFGDFTGGDSGGTDNPGSSGDSGTTGGSCGCPNYSSILSLILDHLSDQSDWLAVFGQAWITATTRILDALENLSPVADPNETELKEATSDAMESVNDSLFADDAPTKVTASDVKDVAQIGEAASSMFDSGVTVGSFFDAFNNINLVSLFTERAKNDLYAVNDVSTYRVDSGDYVVDYYSENLNKIMEFVGKGD